MRKLSTVLAKRAVKFLQERAKVDKEAYLAFYQEFGHFIKEGVYTDFDNKHEVAKLLRFESSRGEAGELISLDDYMGRCVTSPHRRFHDLVTSPPSKSFSRLLSHSVLISRNTMACVW